MKQSPIETNPYQLPQSVAESESQPWWQTNFLLRERVKTPLLERYKLTSLGKELDLLNFSDQALSDDELAQISEALSAVAAFTGGKIFDRALGIALATNESFTKSNDEKEAPAGVGELNKLSPAALINIDAIRRPPNDSYEIFLAKKFPGHSVTTLQYILAHELGHAMDLSYISEVDKHGIDKDRDVPGWVGYGDATGSFTAFEHPDPSVYLLEPSLSSRARVDAQEDFAESFAIASLGGDVSGIPRKYNRIVETIQHAKGQPVTGPHQVSLEKAA